MSSLSLPAVPSRLPRRRWLIGGLLGFGVLINYFDRSILSVAAPVLQKNFGFDDIHKGWLLGAFFWSYALVQIPTGMILDRFGVTRVGRLSALLWGVASTLTAFATGYAGIFAARILLGVAEAPSFPGNSKATGYWFPRQERGLATAIFDAASKFSNVISLPLFAYVVDTFGWRQGFVFSALMSVAYFVAFYLLYRDPSQDPNLQPEEFAHIRAGGAMPEGPSQAGSQAMLLHILCSRKIWGLCLGYAAYGYSFNLFITWLPSYVVDTMDLSIQKSAMVAAIPWVFATVLDLLVGGWLVDHLIKNGHNESKVRKGVFLAGMVGGLAVFGAAVTDNPFLVIACISIALAGLSATAPVGWSLPALLAPKGGTGTVAGLMNFLNNLTGVLASFLTGYIHEKTHSYADAFLVAGIVLVGGILAFTLLLGPVEPVPDPG